jgi:serine/threonine protein kinase
MGEQDIARTIIFDLVQLEKLGAELERRFRLDPATQVVDVLEGIDPEDHMLYLPQLTKLREDLVKRHESGELKVLDTSDEELSNTIDVGQSLHLSLMATAVHEGSEPPPSSRGSSKSDVQSRGSKSVKSEGKLERIDQFRILRELGAGAFGVVYLAEDESLQRKVAIKVPKVSDPTRAASYINEARKAAAIDCKGIVPIYHVGTKENGVPFVVQKLIDGPSLRFLLSRYGSLPPAHAVTLMRDVSVALASAHRQGIYHRDLKPDNVLIDGNGVPWIADFGLAISESEQAQRKGEIAGTLIYMSPEQIQGRADWLDGRSDIWALGIMLYELLLGKPPFAGKNRQSLMEQICHREPRPLQQSSASLTPLNEVFTKCCAKNASDRYASVEELAEALSLLIEQGLPTQTLDGSELRFEQPISQYPSGDGFATRGRSSAAGASTLAGSTSASIGSGSMVQSALVPLSLAESSSRSMRLSGESLPVPAKAEQWTRVVMIAIGLIAVSLLGLQQWNSRRLAVVPEPAPLPDPISDLTLKPSTVPSTVPSMDTEPVVAPEPKVPANALSLEQANGSAELPWIVAPDGSGSHRTISQALTASKVNAHIHVKPGTYEESLKIDKAVTLVAMGEGDDCVISNNDSSPLEIVGDLGPIRVVGFSIRADGRQTKKTFNAVELVSGELRIEKCSLKTATDNCIKVRPGASLNANHCLFRESSAFAISAKGHLEMLVDDCEFFESGVQVVEGHAEISRCKFNGSEGVYVEESQSTATTISDSTFSDCFTYGVLSTTRGDVEVKESRFAKCKIGVWIGNGKASVGRTDFEACTQGISLQGGSLVVSGETQFNRGSYGITVDGGSIEVADASFVSMAASGVDVLAADQIKLQNCRFSDCGECGVKLDGGTSSIEGGEIMGSKEAGLVLGLNSRTAQIRGTKFAGNFGAAIIQEVGDLSASDLAIEKSDIGLLVRAGLESPTTSKLTRVTFAEITDMAVDLDGPAKLTVAQCEFGVLPPEKQYRTLGGADVIVEQ